MHLRLWRVPLEVLADADSVQAKADLSADLRAVYPELVS